MNHLKPLLNPYRSIFPEKIFRNFEAFFDSYERVALQNGYPIKTIQQTISLVLKLVHDSLERPFSFPPYHRQIRSPFDYYQIGLDFIMPLIDLKNSTLQGLHNLKAIDCAIEHGENVILFANHQIEGDPQVFSILLKDQFQSLAENKIFVAGERVLTDPLAAPFSMGCNLLCIYSKKYINNPPQRQREKLLHNKRTMQLMSELLAQGGHCIYVAPSGGRDRPGKSGKVELAEFDPQSIEMFSLMAKRSKKPTHFYPLALATYSILPPPETRQIELGEQRITHGGGVHMHFCDEVDMDHIPGTEGLDKHSQRKVKADYIFQQVQAAYQNFPLNY